MNEYTEPDFHEQYEEMLDDVYGDIKLGYLTFQPSRIIRELDPIAYHIGYTEFVDEMLGEEDE